MNVTDPRRRRITGWVALSWLLPGPVLAGGDGGGQSGTKSKPKPKSSGSEGGLSFLSQDAFMRMTNGDFVQARRSAKKDGKVLVVRGFSTRMTGPLLEMKEADPRSLRRLMRDMRGLKTRKAREARLDKEYRAQSQRIKIYTENINSARGSSDSATRASAEEDRQRRQKARAFRRELVDWERDPFEGTY